jgi:hypothetical protein
VNNNDGDGIYNHNVEVERKNIMITPHNLNKKLNVHIDITTAPSFSSSIQKPNTMITTTNKEFKDKIRQFQFQTPPPSSLSSSSILNNYNYRWISFIRFRTLPAILNTLIVRLFILRNLDIAFQPNFRDILLDYLISLEDWKNVNEYLALFQIQFGGDDSDEKLNTMIENKLIEGTHNLWNAIFREIMATETAFFWRLRWICSSRNRDFNINEPQIDIQTWDNNYFQRTTWTPGSDKRGFYYDYYPELAAQRNEIVENRFKKIRFDCATANSGGDNDYDFNKLIQQMCEIDPLYDILLKEELAYEEPIVIVLLDGNFDYTYLGHVYLLPNDSDSGHDKQITMQSIRSSLMNNLVTKCNYTRGRSRIAEYLIKAAEVVACNLGKTRILALGTIGGFGKKLENLGWKKEKEKEKVRSSSNTSYLGNYILDLDCKNMITL